MLQNLQADISLSNKRLNTPYASIPLIDIPKEKETNDKIHKYSYKIPPRCEKIIKIPVDKNMENGYINHIRFQNGLEIPACLIKSTDYEAFTKILNTSEEEIPMVFAQKIEVTEIEENVHINHIEYIDQNQYDNLLKQN